MARARAGRHQIWRAAADAHQAEAVALPQRKFEQAGRHHPRRLQSRPRRLRFVALTHGCTGVHQHPGRHRAVALGLAHEEAVRACVQFPVHLPQFVARLVGAVLRELQARAAAATWMLAVALATMRARRGQAELAQPRTQRRRDQRLHRRAQASGAGSARNNAATTSSALRPSASAVKDSNRRWRITGAASAATSSRVAA